MASIMNSTDEACKSMVDARILGMTSLPTSSFIAVQNSATRSAITGVVQRHEPWGQRPHAAAAPGRL